MTRFHDEGAAVPAVPSAKTGRIDLTRWSTVLALFALSAGGAAQTFGPVKITHQSLVQGPTHHGYFEHRFLVMNSHEERTMQVEIVLPERSFGGGNIIRELRRSASVGPRSSVVIPLLQPPLPVQGINQARVHVGGRHVGEVSLNRGFQHVSAHHHSSGPPPRNLLVSRSLNSSSLDTALRAGAGSGASAPSGSDYSADRATGAADIAIGNRTTYHRLAWVPERPGAGREFLELEYDPPLPAGSLRLRQNGRTDSYQTLRLLNTAGAEISAIIVTNGSNRYTGRYEDFDIAFPKTTQAVAKVRLEMDTYGRGNLAIDAAQLRGGGGTNGWAVKASASSTYAARFGGSRSGSGSGDHPEVLRAEFEVTDWSDNWLAYTCFDAVFVAAGDFAGMPDGVKDALWRFTETGGTLLVRGKAPLPATWNGMLEKITTGLNRYRVGFGECLEFLVVGNQELDSAQISRILIATRTGAAVWTGFGDEAQAQGVFPVIENISIPVRGVAFIMLLFIVLVGPLNIWLLARRNRRIWLLWTIPAISLVTCGIVFAYSLFSEGITPSVRVEGVTLLDHAARRATTLGRLGYYSPLTPAGGLRFGYDTELTPNVNRTGYRDGGSPRSLNWAEGQHLQSGWVAARVPAWFAVRKSETRRERLQVERQADGGIAVVNGLGVELESVSFADRDGQLWQTTALAAGAKAVLVKGSNSDRRPAADFRKRFLNHQWHVMDELVTEAPNELAPGHYVAVAKEAPFLETGLDRQMKLRSRSIIHGILSPEELAK